MTDTPKPDAPVEERHQQLAVDVCNQHYIARMGRAAQLLANFERDRTADLEKRLADAQRALLISNQLRCGYETDYAGNRITDLDCEFSDEQVALARAARGIECDDPAQRAWDALEGKDTR